VKSWITKPKLGQVSHSHGTCEADLSLFWHFLQMRLLTSLNLKSCPFRWQCPVSSPVIYFSWFLFSCNSSLILLAEGLCMPVGFCCGLCARSLRGCCGNSFWASVLIIPWIYGLWLLNYAWPSIICVACLNSHWWFILCLIYISCLV
jgi:hypothetical protein